MKRMSVEITPTILSPVHVTYIKDDNNITIYVEGAEERVVLSLEQAEAVVDALIYLLARRR